MAFGTGFDPFESTNVDDLGLVPGFAYGVESVAFPGPFESQAFDVFAGEPGGKGANDFLANRAEKAGVFIALVDAIAGCAGDECLELLSVFVAACGVKSRRLAAVPVPIHGCTHLCVWRNQVVNCVAAGRTARSNPSCANVVVSKYT
jgi:hypothetical protein